MRMPARRALLLVPLFLLGLLLSGCVTRGHHHTSASSQPHFRLMSNNRSQNPQWLRDYMQRLRLRPFRHVEDKDLSARMALQEIKLGTEDDLRMDLLLAMENRGRVPRLGGHLRLQGDAPSCLAYELQLSQYQPGVSPSNAAATSGQRSLWLQSRCRLGSEMTWNNEITLFEEVSTSGALATGLSTQMNWSSSLPGLYGTNDWRIGVTSDFKRHERDNDSGDYRSARVDVTLQGDLGLGWKSKLDVLVGSRWVTGGHSSQGGTRQVSLSLVRPLYWSGFHAHIKPSLGWRSREALSGRAWRTLHTGLMVSMDHRFSRLSLDVGYRAHHAKGSVTPSLAFLEALSLSMNYELQLDGMR